jgi:DNA invertase Pin-like site-specific DNA recombinase
MKGGAVREKVGNGQEIGYIRVSSAGQNDERQLNGLNLDAIFREKISGSSINRPKLKECLKYLRNGDTLHIHSMDRLARNLKDLQTIVDSLIKKNVKVHFHKENLIFKGDNSPIDNLLLQVMGAVSEFERNLIRERQLEGIENARRKGKHLGRKKTLTKTQIKELKEMTKNGIHKTKIAEKFGISRQSVYSYLKNS